MGDDDLFGFKKNATANVKVKLLTVTRTLWTSIDIAPALGKIITKFISRTPFYLSACSNITQHKILTKSMEY